MDTIKKEPEKVKDRIPSTTYTIKSFKGVIQKMKSLKMVTDQEDKELRKIYESVVQRWISIGMKLE